MEITAKLLGLFTFIVALTSCNSLNDCEKNLIEGIGVSKRAYLTIQDEDLFLTANEVEKLLAAIPLNGNDIREMRFNIRHASRVHNNCIKDIIYDNKKSQVGCYTGELTIIDKNYYRKNGSDSQKFSVLEFANAVREKYPAYNGYSDMEIATAFAKKYPAYNSQIDFGAVGDSPKFIGSHIAVDFDLNGYFTEHDQKKYYFDKSGLIQLSFDEDLPVWKSISAKIKIVYRLERNNLLYEKIISTFEDDELKSKTTISGTLARVSNSIEGCN